MTRYTASRARAAVVVFALTAVLGVFSAGCTSDEKATEALRASGFRSIEMTGWSPFSCSKDDSTCTGFRAVGPTGEPVDGAVGCGFVFKGCTVRITGSAR